MCGIIGAVAQHDITQILLKGLHRLEYRGYDSAGLAIVNSEGNLNLLRRSGKVQELINAAKKNPLCGNIGIAHTRWATHGEPTEYNAHPQVSEYIVVVHNGVIENYKKLRKILKKRGYIFVSETDTEVISHLIHWEMIRQNNTLVEVIWNVIPQLKGIYSIVIMDSRDSSTLLAVNSGSPLVIGLGIKENFIASDQLALLSLTHNFIFLEEGDIAKITNCKISIFNKFKIQVKREKIESHLKYDVTDKGIYHHYMEKEIYEQPNAIRSTINQYIIDGNKVYLKELDSSNANDIFMKMEHIQVIACGTSYNSGMVFKYWVEELTGIPCDVEIASEFCYRKPAIRRNSLMITISQSGETADTLSALRLSKKLGYISSLTICNVQNSSIVRESSLAIMTKAGIEMSVASTKTFTTQLTVLLLLVAKLVKLKTQNNNLEYDIIHNLQSLPRVIEQILLLNKVIKQLAKDLAEKQSMLFLGRGNQYPIALEGALKLKEVSYIHAEAYAAGELKHGPLALVDNNIPLIVLAPNNKLLKKLKSNIEEISSRGGKLYVFSDQKSYFMDDGNIHIIKMPHIKNIITPISYIIPLQLLSYYIAFIKNLDIDRPRNLAKSVTVE